MMTTTWPLGGPCDQMHYLFHKKFDEYDRVTERLAILEYMGTIYKRCIAKAEPYAALGGRNPSPSKDM